MEIVMVASKNKQLKILLVEDEALVMKVHCMMLKNMGYTPDMAVTGEDAIAMSHKDYDIIFMDIGLPGVSGTEATAEIRRLENENGKKQAYIVALTGYGRDQEVQEKCQAAGIDIVHTKPITAEKLQQIISQF